MVTPLAFVVDVHAFLAFSRGFDRRAIAVNDGFLEETVGLLLPDFHTDRVKHFHQLPNGRKVKPSTKVTCSCGVGNAFRTQRIQIRFVIPAKLEMVEACSARTNVVRHVEDMVGLRVRQIELQQRNVSIDGLVQFERLDHVVNQADASACDCLMPIRDLIVNVRRRKLWALRSRWGRRQSFLNPPLACPQLPSYLVARFAVVVS